MINGEEYSWEDMWVVMGGKAIVGITEIEYSGKKEHTNIYGRGDEPVAVGRGRKTNEGKLVLLQSDFEALCESSPDNDPRNLKGFTITVSYAPKAGARVKTDQLEFCRIGEWKKGMKEGDSNMTVELPLVIGRIRLNV